MVTYFVTGSPTGRKKDLDQVMREGASAFLSAALELDEAKQSWVRYFLLFHAIELGLKSVLARHGVSERDLISLRHDIPSIIGRVEAVGLSLTPSEKQAFLAFEFLEGDDRSDASVALRFNYFGSTKCPDMEVLTAAAESLIVRVRENYKP